MERTEILLILVLVISILSLWFSYKTYERKMRKHHHGCNYPFFMETYSGREGAGASRARAAIQVHEREQSYRRENDNKKYGGFGDDWPAP